MAEIEARIVEVHGPGQITLVNYGGNNRKPSTFQCLAVPSHPAWKTALGHVINHGSGCAACKGLAVVPLEEVERRIVESHEPGLIELVSYGGAVTKRSEFRCLRDRTHGNWTTLTWCVTKMGSGCPRCSNNLPVSAEQLERRIVERHGPGRIQLVSYAGSTGDKSSEFRCLVDPSHGTWRTQANSVATRGTGCPHCGRAKGNATRSQNRRSAQA